MHSSSIVILLLATFASNHLLAEDATTGKEERAEQNTRMSPVSFHREIAPIITRCGCNAASCHGAADGQGGLKFSLFGYDARSDFDAITEQQSERIDFDKPEGSLLLMKTTSQVDHEGGERFPAKSHEYRLLHRWIEEGCKLDEPQVLEALELKLERRILSNEEPTSDLRLIAHFADGLNYDVTRLASFQVIDDSIVRLDSNSKLLKVGPGDTSIVATYAGRSANADVWVPRADAVATSQTTISIDSFIDRKIQSLGIAKSTDCDDSVFLRRAYQTIIGQLPNPSEVRTFLESESPSKRSEVVDRLLSHPLHSNLWATRFCEITGSRDYGTSRQAIDPLMESKWHAWFSAQFASDTPYDDMVRGVLTATSRQGESAKRHIQTRIAKTSLTSEETVADYAARESLDIFFQRPSQNEAIELESITERISAAFIGVRIECARCHKHPFDRWTQNDHRSLMNIFAPLRFGMSADLRGAMLDALEEQRERVRQKLPKQRVPRTLEVYETAQFHDQKDEYTNERLPARALGGPVISADNRREAFVEWLVAEENPFFAHNIVNRVWAFYFGRGLVEPLDAFSASNPPTHPELLEFLASSFVNSGYSIRWLERQILLSQTWQRSPRPKGSNQSDTRNYSRFQVRLLRADALVDCLALAIGDQAKPVVSSPSFEHSEANTNTYFEVFERPERKLVCDCEVNAPPSLRQSMLLMADSKLMTRIQNGRVAKLVEDDVTTEAIVEELFLSALSRFPTANELEFSKQQIESSSDAKTALTDLLWSLVNTREFVTIH